MLFLLDTVDKQLDDTEGVFRATQQRLQARGITKIKTTILKIFTIFLELCLIFCYESSWIGGRAV